MNKEEFFFHSIREKLLDDLNWYYEVFGILLPGSVYTHVMLEDDKFVTSDGTVIDGDVTEPLLDVNMVIVLKSGMMSNVSSDTETTIGKAVINYTLLCNNFGVKIPYNNGEVLR